MQQGLLRILLFLHLRLSLVSTGYWVLGFVQLHQVLGQTLAVYDAASTSDLSSANLLGEDSSANTASAGYDFPAPIPLSNGLYVAQGAQTTVTIYYERTIP
jgi:hypothetical protein